MPHIGLITKGIPLKVFLHQFRFRETQDSLQIANPVTRILLTWTAGATLHAMSSSTKTSTHRAWQNPRKDWDRTQSKNSLIEALEGLPW